MDNPIFQQIFDKVVLHLLTQNTQSVTRGGNGCRYRGVNGTMCAVGCLIDDDEYDACMEQHSVQEEPLQDWIQQKYPNVDNITSFLYDLQQVHDLSRPGQWMVELKDVAEMYDLKTDVFKHFEPTLNPETFACFNRP